MLYPFLVRHCPRHRRCLFLHQVLLRQRTPASLKKSGKSCSPIYANRQDTCCNGVKGANMPCLFCPEPLLYNHDNIMGGQPSWFVYNKDTIHNNYIGLLIHSRFVYPFFYCIYNLFHYIFQVPLYIAPGSIHMASAAKPLCNLRHIYSSPRPEAKLIFPWFRLPEQYPDLNPFNSPCVIYKPVNHFLGCLRLVEHVKCNKKGCYLAVAANLQRV